MIFGKPNIEPRIKIPFSIWSGIFILSVVIIFLAQFGYTYIVKLNEPDKNNQKIYLEREQLILNEIYWFDKWKISFNSPHRVYLDTADRYFLKSLDTIYKRVEIFTSDEIRNIINKQITPYAFLLIKDRIKDTIESIKLIKSLHIDTTDTFYIKAKAEPDTTKMRKLQLFQKEFEKKVFELRSREWEPKLNEVAKSAFVPIVIFGLILLFVSIVFRYFYGSATDLRASPFRIFALWIPALYFIIIYIIMSSSGRTDPSVFCLTHFFQKFNLLGSKNFFNGCNHILYIILSIFFLPFLFSWILGVIFVKNRKKKFDIHYNYGAKAKFILDWTILFFLIVLLLICLYMIINAYGKEIYGARFYQTTISKLIIAEYQPIEFISLELSIGMIVLIVALFYMFFPIMVASTRKGGKFNASWSDSYHYFIRGIFSEKSVEFTLGLVGSILILMASFLFTSANSFALEMLFNRYGRIFTITILLILGSFFITFTKKVFTLIFLSIILIIIVLKKFIPQLNLWYLVLIPTIGLLLIFNYLIIKQKLKMPWKYSELNIGLRYYSIFIIISLILIAIDKFSPELKSRLFFWSFQLQTQEIPYHIIKPVALIAIIPLLILWLQPLILGISRIDDIFTKQTTLILRKVLMELKDHSIVFGYGDLGLKVGRGIVKRFIDPQKHTKQEYEYKYKFAEIYSTRRDEVLKVCKNIVVVDKETATFDEAYPDNIYDKIGICDIDVPHYVKGERIKVVIDEKEISKEKIENRSDIVFLGIQGNCIEPGIQDKVNLETSQCVILSARDDKATFPVFNEIYKLHQEKESKYEPKLPTAILGAESSLYGAYLEWRCVKEAIYFLFPAQLRGITVGEIICDEMINQSQNKEREALKEYIKQMKVMILGRENPLYYIIHTLGEDLRRFLNFNETEANNFLQNNLFVVSNDDFIKNNHISRPSGNYWQIRATAIGLPSVPAQDPFIPVFIHSPSDATFLKFILENEDKKPNVIVIATRSSDETLGITHEILMTLKRINAATDEPYTPSIIIGTRRIEWSQIRDALAYWRKKYFSDSSFYPIQEIDSVIDYYDDAAQMNLGLYDTLQEKDSRPIEITDCAMNIPGILGEITAYLSGLQFKTNMNGETEIPNFHNYRSVNNGSANFSKLIRGKGRAGQDLGYCFFSGATLEKKDMAKLSEEVKKSPRSCVIGVAKNNLELISNLIYNQKEARFFRHQGCTKDEKKCQTNCLVEPTCPKRRLCPIDNFRRHLEAADKVTKNEHKQYYFCNPPENTIEKATTPFETYAQIALCGYGAEQCGAMARAINLLLFREVDIKKIFENNNKKYPDSILDITYTRSFGCYCPQRSYQKIYGRLKENPFKLKENPFKDESTLKKIRDEPYFNALLIRPTSKDSFDKWLGYAKAVLTVKNTPQNANYRLVVGRSIASKNNEIILIYRYNWGYFNKIFKDELYIKFLDDLYEKKIYKLDESEKKTSKAKWEEYKQFLRNKFNWKKYFKEEIFKKPDIEKILDIPIEIEPDMFLFIVRGTQEPNYRLLGHCMVRETTCPFEKIRDEAERYGIIWTAS